MITSYSQLTISQFDAISDILNSEMDNQHKDARILSILSGKSEDEIWSMDTTDVLSLMSQAKFLASVPETKDILEFQYQGYSFKIPTSLTYAQYVDFESADNSNLILHAICVPEGHVYNKDYVLDFSDLPCVTALSILKSFTNGLMVSSVASVKSSLRKLLLRNPLKLFSKSYRTAVRSLQGILSSSFLRRLPI